MVNIGLTDNGATEDLLNINNYTTGLKNFIISCDTPMTISIQGTWGTGKTSIMNIVKKELDNTSHSVCIWFNAWQFSQFDMGDELAKSLLSYLVDTIKIEDNSKIEKLTNVIKKAGSIGSKVALSGLGKALGNTDLESDISNLDSCVTLKAIEGFKEEFSKCVQKTLKKNEKERLVIFIDDLDRLEPRKAVELLEVLKLFLDCENCVFVLAIDYDVVVHGVARKYGYDSNNNEHTYEIGKMFFDKIIQVPFKVPVAHYDITNYIEKSLDNIGITIGSIEIYEQLIRNSIGTNPRAMKRIFNAFLLVKLVVGNDEELDEKSYQLLFAILCLQHCNENLYNYIVENRENFNEKSIEELFAEEHTNFDLLPASDDISVKELYEMHPLLGNIKDLIVNKGKISKNNYEKFLQILNLSVVTSTSKKMNTKGSTEVYDSKNLKFQNLNTEIIDDIVNRIKEIDSNFKVGMKNLYSGKGKIYASIKGKEFIEIYPRVEGYRVEMSFNCEGSRLDLNSLSEDERAFIENNSSWEVKNKKIVHTVKNHHLEIEDVIRMVKAANSSWNA